jgi:hypothetical protein
MKILKIAHSIGQFFYLAEKVYLYIVKFMIEIV